MFEKFKEDTRGIIDAGAGITIGVLIASIMVIAYVIYTINAQIVTGTTLTGSDFARLNNTLQNITGLLDTTIGLLIIVVVVALLALALLALIILKKRAD